MNIQSLLRKLSGPHPLHRVADSANLGCWHPSTTEIYYLVVRIVTQHLFEIFETKGGDQSPGNYDDVTLHTHIERRLCEH